MRWRVSIMHPEVVPVLRSPVLTVCVLRAGSVCPPRPLQLPVARGSVTLLHPVFSHPPVRRRVGVDAVPIGHLTWNGCDFRMPAPY